MPVKRLRFATFYGGVLVALLFVLPLWIPATLLFRLHAQFTWPAGVFFRVVLPLLGIRVEVQGREHLEDLGPAVIVANHQSQLDIGMILGYLRPVSFLAKAELFRIPVFGSLLKLSGCLRVYRGDRKRNEGLGERLHRALEEGQSFCVFPEGTRSPDGQLLPFKTGIFHYIKSGDSVCLPIVIQDAHRIWPKGALWIHPGTVRLIILPPMRARDYASLSAEEFRDTVRQGMARHL